MMGIQTSGCEIVGFLKKFKDAEPADPPPCVSRRGEEAKHCHFGVDRAPEEQSRGTQEQIVVAVEVISTIDEGRLGEHVGAALLVRRERLPVGAFRSRAGSHRLRAVVGVARPRPRRVS